MLQTKVTCRVWPSTRRDFRVPAPFDSDVISDLQCDHDPFECGVDLDGLHAGRLITSKPVEYNLGLN